MGTNSFALKALKNFNFAAYLTEFIDQNVDFTTFHPISLVFPKVEAQFLAFIAQMKVFFTIKSLESSKDCFM